MRRRLLPPSPTPLAWCLPPPGKAAAWTCELQSHDSLGLRFQAGWQPVGELDGRLAVDVLDASGAVAQTIKRSGPVLALQARDLDRDGRDELLIESSCGTGGCSYDVWRAVGQSVQFRNMGGIFGKSLGHVASGLMVTDEVAGGSNIVTFFRFGDTKIENLAVVRFDPSGREENAPRTCALLQDRSNLALLGIDAATAERRFCQEAREVDWQ